MSDSPAVVLRQAAARVRDPHPGPEFSSIQGPWLALQLCGLAEPLAAWLEAVVAEMTVVDGTEYQAYDDDQNEFSSWNAALTTAHIILGTPKETTA